MRRHVSTVATAARRLGARRRFRRALRPSDVLIVGYPRSGTTWLGFMLANATKPDLDEELSLKTFGRYVPDVNDLYFWGQEHADELTALKDPRLLRVHAPYDAAFPRVVYVIRDPRDTLVSYFHFLRYVRPGTAATLPEFVADESAWPVPWDQHVLGWLRADHPPRLVVRYEEMHEQPFEVLARVAAFTGLAVSDERVAAAVEESSFDRMRGAEERGSVWEVGARGREVRRGAVGAWRDELDEQSLRAIEARYGAAMAEAGYG
jgi:hypothetical protein